MTASVLKQDPNTKRFKRTLIYFNTDTVCTFSGTSPLSSHKTTFKQRINGHKRWKMKEKKDLSCLCWFFTVCSVLGRLHDCLFVLFLFLFSCFLFGFSFAFFFLLNLPSTEQAVKTQPKQDKSFSFICHRFWPFICCLSVVLWLYKGDVSENLHTVSPCQNK